MNWIKKKNPKMDCSGGVSWAWKILTGHDAPFLSCCVKHDHLYWDGGDGIDRLLADIDLMQCTIGKGYPKWAQILFVGVRIGGWFRAWRYRAQKKKLYQEIDRNNGIWGE